MGTSLAADKDGNVWAWGDNDVGQLGNHSRIGSLLPIKLAAPQHAKAVATGGNHSLALLEDGTVWAWGDNQDGELGVGTRTDSDVPLKVEGLDDVVAIAAGGRHSLALRRDGTVMLWGTNGYGQLCNGTTTSAATPIPLQAPSDKWKYPPRIVTLAAGQFHTLVVDDTGHVWSCGWNVFGQLGNGAASKPREGETHLVEVLNLDDVIAVAAGHLHSLALRRDGTGVRLGYNTQGQVGNESSETHAPDLVKHVKGAIALTAGATTSLVVLADHSVEAWGANVFGAIGNNSLHNFNGPTKVPALRNVRLLVAGGNRGMAIADPPPLAPLATIGSGDHGQLGPFHAGDDDDAPDALRYPRSIGAGWQHSLAVASDGTVWAWGRNDHGQLGNGQTKIRKNRCGSLDSRTSLRSLAVKSTVSRCDPTEPFGRGEATRTASSEGHRKVTPWFRSRSRGSIRSWPSQPAKLTTSRCVSTAACGRGGLNDHGQLGLMGGGETRVSSEVH